jgi:hypothetical protein
MQIAFTLRMLNAHLGIKPRSRSGSILFAVLRSAPVVEAIIRDETAVNAGAIRAIRRETAASEALESVIIDIRTALVQIDEGSGWRRICQSESRWSGWRLPHQHGQKSSKALALAGLRRQDLSIQ